MAPMTCATAVCERKLKSGVGFVVSGLVDAYLFPANASIVKVATLQDKRLLRRLARVLPDSREDELIQFREINFALDILLELQNIDLAKAMVESFPRVCITTAITTAATYGQTEFLQWLHERHQAACWGGEEITQAAQSGHIDTVKWLHQNTTPLLPQPLLEIGARQADGALLDFAIQVCQERPIERDLQAAVMSGCLNNLIKLSTMLPDSPIYAYHACYGGHLDVIKWLNNHGGVFSPDMMAIAASQGHLHLVQWLHAFRSEGCSTDAMDRAVQNGHLDVVKWLLRNRTEGCSRWAMSSAITGKHYDVIQELYDCCSDDWIGALVDEAAKSGSFDLVRWAYNTYPKTCTPEALSFAALSGNKEVFNWLHTKMQIQCPSASVISKLAFKGDLEMMQDKRIDTSDMIEHPYIRIDAMQSAAINGHIHILEWLYDPSVRPQGASIFEAAARAGKLNSIKWLHEHEFPSDGRAMDEAARAGHLEVVKWLHFNRTEGCSTQAMANAAERDHLHVMQFLREHRTEGCCTRAPLYAASEGHLEVLQWLKLYYPDIVSRAFVEFDAPSMIEYASQYGWGAQIVQALER
jgi:Ankyrin repeats (3 copies)